MYRLHCSLGRGFGVGLNDIDSNYVSSAERLTWIVVCVSFGLGTLEARCLNRVERRIDGLRAGGVGSVRRLG